MLSEDEQRQRRRIWLSGTAALLVVAAAAAAWVVQHVPRDIAARTLTALQAAGLDGRAAVAVEGRTVVLTGQVPDAYTRARLRAIAASIRGVGAVRDQLAVAPVPAEAPPPVARAPRPALPQMQMPPSRPPDPPAVSLRPAETRAEAIAAAAPDPPPATAAAEVEPAPPPAPDRAPAAPAPPPAKAAAGLPEAPPASSTPKPASSPSKRASAAHVESGGRLPLLHFEFDSTRLTPDSEPRLQAIVELLRERPELRVEVAGHADAVGSRSYNQRLSLRRARAVAQRLVAAGIDGGRLQPRGYHESRPLKDNRTREGRAMNRRVELVLIQ